VLLEQGPPDGLRGVRGEDEIDGLVLESVEDLVARFAELRDEALERLLNVGLGGRRGLVGEVSPLALDPPSVRDLHLLGEVGEVEHVREGAGDDDGVRRRQAGELAPEIDQPRLVPIVLVLRRELVALLNLRARRDKEIRHADLEAGRGWRREWGRSGRTNSRRCEPCRPWRMSRKRSTRSASYSTSLSSSETLPGASSRSCASMDWWRSNLPVMAESDGIESPPDGAGVTPRPRDRGGERGNGGDWSERGDGGGGDRARWRRRVDKPECCARLFVPGMIR
jgi:hypothetical protein